MSQKAEGNQGYCKIRGFKILSWSRLMAGLEPKGNGNPPSLELPVSPIVAPKTLERDRNPIPKRHRRQTESCNLDRAAGVPLIESNFFLASLGSANT
jgi:hypothetical protein